MRIAALGATLLIGFTACSTTSTTETDSTYQQPNSLMGVEITRRVEQIPFQHREELLQNLMWLAQAGEQTIPALLQGLRHENPKVRSSSAWVLGRIRDRRTIPQLQAATRDNDPTVKLECARTLVVLGDLTYSPALIEGLDSERKEVRYLCHEALKTSTGHDFGYDHLNANKDQMQVSVLRWRQWWSEYSGDALFAQNYQAQHGIKITPAAPGGETKPQDQSQPQPQTDGSQQPMPNGTQPDSQQNGAQGSGQTQTNGNQNGPGTEPMPNPAGQVVPVPAPTPTPTPRTNGGN